MPLSPYIAFSGNCAAAIAFYQQALGAELIHKITWGEMPRIRRTPKMAALPASIWLPTVSRTPACALPIVS